MSEIAVKGQRIYDEKLKNRLEPAEIGKFVAIDPDSENYFVAETALEAAKTARAAIPDKVFFTIKIGYPAAYKMGGYVKRNR